MAPVWAAGCVVRRPAECCGGHRLETRLREVRQRTRRTDVVQGQTLPLLPEVAGLPGSSIRGRRSTRGRPYRPSRRPEICSGVHRRAAFPPPRRGAGLKLPNRKIRNPFHDYPSPDCGASTAKSAIWRQNAVPVRILARSGGRGTKKGCSRLHVLVPQRSSPPSPRQGGDRTGAQGSRARAQVFPQVQAPHALRERLPDRASTPTKQRAGPAGAGAKWRPRLQGDVAPHGGRNAHREPSAKRHLGLTVEILVPGPKPEFTKTVPRTNAGGRHARALDIPKPVSSNRHRRKRTTSRKTLQDRRQDRAHNVRQVTASRRGGGEFSSAIGEAKEMRLASPAIRTAETAHRKRRSGRRKIGDERAFPAAWKNPRHAASDGQMIDMPAARFVRPRMACHLGPESARTPRASGVDTVARVQNWVAKAGGNSTAK